MIHRLQRLEQRHGPWITKLQGRGVLAFDPLRLGDRFENGLPDPAVLSELLNLKESSVGLKAYGPQGGQVLESSADAEVVGIVEGHLSTPGPVLLEVLLDLRALGADLQRGVYAFRDEAAVEGRASLLRNTEVEQPFGFVEALQTALGNSVYHF